MSNAALPVRRDKVEAISRAHNDLCESTSRCLSETAIAHNKLVAATTDLLDLTKNHESRIKELESQLEVEKSKTKTYEWRLQALERHREF